MYKLTKETKRNIVLVVAVVLAIVLAKVFTSIATSHNHELTKVTAVQATCTQEGTMAHYRCNGCEKLFSDSKGKKELSSIATPKLDHQYGAWVETVAATCVQGEKERVCANCGDQQTAAIAATQAHDVDVNGDCTKCSHRQPTEGLAYTLSDRGYYTVSGRGTATGELLIIADSIDGVPVRKIDSQAFQGDATLKKVVIPSNMREIDPGAFAGCKKLTTVEMEDVPFEIHEDAFNGCTALTDLTLPDGLRCIGERAFYECSSLTELTVPSTITDIADSAFAKCSTLKKVTYTGTADEWVEIWFGYNANPLSNSADLYIGEEKVTRVTLSATKISDYAFQGCTSLTNFSLTSEVTEIGGRAFLDCVNLSAAYVPNGVTAIGAEAFAGCKALKSATIGKGVSTISNSMFRGCANLSNITISDSVTTIENNAFFNCKNLTSVTIGKGVYSIGYGAFEGCTNLTSVHFKNAQGWYAKKTLNADPKEDIAVALGSDDVNVDCLTTTYCHYYWQRS